MSAVPLRQRFWLSFPPVVLCLADAGLTLWGQSPAYWHGNFATVREFNPLGHILLAFHPAAFAIGIGVYLFLTLLLLIWLPQRWSVGLAFAMSLGHVVGGASWLAREGLDGWLLALILVVISERLVGISWRKAGLTATELPQAA